MDGGSVVCAGAHKRPVHPEHKTLYWQGFFASHNHKELEFNLNKRMFERFFASSNCHV
jgi:hypothetical protein